MREKNLPISKKNVKSGSNTLTMDRWSARPAHGLIMSIPTDPCTVPQAGANAHQHNSEGCYGGRQIDRVRTSLGLTTDMKAVD